MQFAVLSEAIEFIMVQMVQLHIYFSEAQNA
jgi:hypothetical protein